MRVGRDTFGDPIIQKILAILPDYRCPRMFCIPLQPRQSRKNKHLGGYAYERPGLYNQIGKYCDGAICCFNYKFQILAPPKP